MQKWKNKFEKAVQNRAYFKRNFLADQDRTILNSNSNFVGKDADERLSQPRYTGGTMQPKFSEFKKVIKRRKSR